RRNSGERLVEATVDGLRQLVAKRRQLGERRLEIRTLGRELLETLLLGLVLLLGEWIDLPERLATRFEPGHARGELVAVHGVGVVRRLGLGLARVRSGYQRLVETPSRLPRLAVEPRQLDLDPVHPLGRLVERVAHLDLGGAEPAELRTELSGASGTWVHPRAHGRLEAGGERRCALE